MGASWWLGDIGLSPSEVVVKEIKEESGFEAEAVRLLAVLDKKFHNHPPEPYHVYKFFILCRIVGGEAMEGVETSEVSFLQKISCLSSQQSGIQRHRFGRCLNIYEIRKK